MSMLSRFRKPGGFLQLVNLIESCEPEKRKNLLKLVSSEDPGWAHLVSKKTLSFERIISWPEPFLAELIAHLPDSIVVVGYHMISEDPLRNKWAQCISNERRITIKNMITESTNSPSEYFAATVKIIKTVRELEIKGDLRLSQFDPALVIDTRLAS